MSTISMTMANRQVEGKESITPAGTFDTYKITSDMENWIMGMPIRSSMHVVSYRAPNQILDV